MKPLNIIGDRLIAEVSFTRTEVYLPLLTVRFIVEVSSTPSEATKRYW